MVMKSLRKPLQVKKTRGESRRQASARKKRGCRAMSKGKARGRFGLPLGLLI